jgi:tetratricopeptide (TPR) repeat protein
VLADSHQHDQARDAAQRAQRLAPDSSRANEALGYALSAAGDMGGAIRSLQKAVKIDPKNGRAWGLLAAERVRAARTPTEFADADAALAKADEFLPASPLVPYYRGLLLSARRDYPAAVKEFRRALERKPYYSDALYNLSVALALSGRKEESAATRARFERLHNYERDINNLQLQLGRDPNNKELWQKMKELATSFGDASRTELAREKTRAMSHSR